MKFKSFTGLVKKFKLLAALFITFVTGIFLAVLSVYELVQLFLLVPVAVAFGVEPAFLYFLFYSDSPLQANPLMSNLGVWAAMFFLGYLFKRNLNKVQELSG